MQPVLDYLAANEACFLRELCDYLRFPSVSAQPQHKPDLERCAAWIADHCRALGLQVHGYSPALLWLGCGNKDGLIRISQGVHNYLKEKKVPHIWHVDGNGHDATHWRNSLYWFSQQLFR